MLPETLNLIMNSEVKKGDVLGVAQIAGIMGAKKTPELIPLCHTLNLASAHIQLTCDDQNSCVEITATCKSSGKTGVEMEALTAVSVALLTIYDMCKSVDKTMRIEGVRLVEKSGGLSGDVRLK